MNNLKKIREGLGVTQEQLAEKTGLRIATISRAENGHSDPKASTWKWIAKVLKVTVEELKGE